MVTAEELIVSITSDGTQETQDDLEGVERSMENTADSAGDSAEELEGFSQRFQGAMGAAVAALAVGAAGLLSQVPVLGEAFSGLGAIVEALSFQMDSVLRPILSPLTDFFFELSNAIFEADGAMGTLIGVGTSFVSIAAVIITTIATIGSLLGVWASTAAGVIAVLAKLGGVVLTVISLLEPISTIILLIIGALVLLQQAWSNNWFGIRDITADVMSVIRNTIVGGFLDLASRALDALGDFATDTRAALSDVAARFTSWAGDLAGRAFAWGRNLIDRFIAGIRAAIGRLRDLLDGLRDIGATVGVSLPDTSGVGGGSGGGGASGRPRFGAGGGASTGGQQIDGRQISESTGRYRSDPGRRRGI